LTTSKKNTKKPNPKPIFFSRGAAPHVFVFPLQPVPHLLLLASQRTNLSLSRQTGLSFFSNTTADHHSILLPSQQIFLHFCPQRKSASSSAPSPLHLKRPHLLSPLPLVFNLQHRSLPLSSVFLLLQTINAVLHQAPQQQPSSSITEPSPTSPETTEQRLPHRPAAVLLPPPADPAHCFQQPSSSPSAPSPAPPPSAAAAPAVFFSFNRPQQWQFLPTRQTQQPLLLNQLPDRDARPSPFSPSSPRRSASTGASPPLSHCSSLSPVPLPYRRSETEKR